MLIQPQWQACRVTLLHGAFSAKASNGKAARRLNVAMAAVGLFSLSLLLGPRIAMASMLVQQENQIQQEIQQVYEHHFPSMRHKTNIKYHFGQNMKKQGKGSFFSLTIWRKPDRPFRQWKSTCWNTMRGRIR